MTHRQDRGELDGKDAPEEGGQLRALSSIFHWLVGEVVAARISSLRLATDLVRAGVLSVDDINSVPLSQEIIDSVLQHFPQDTSCRAMGVRLRETLEALRDLEQESLAETLDYADGGGRGPTLKN